MPWSPLVEHIKQPKKPQALSDVRQLLARLVDAFGVNELGRLLDVSPAMITRWRRATPISPEMARRIIDLHDVLNRALQIFRPRQAMLWLVGSEPLLDGARPIDVLVMHGAAPVINALTAFERGVYV
ncbi:hypothetical protein EPN44_10145 [bacterium]|nr:MAG: hypothetical protein EPN44_10145 [bacterium]